MAIEINGSTGISGVDGSASTPAIQGSDTNTGISFGTDEVEINTGGVERVKVDSSGKFGIGQTSPNALLEVNSDTDGQEVARFEGNYAASGDVTLANFRRNGGAVAAAVQYHDSLTATSIGSTTNHAFAFRTNDTERMRLLAGGALCVNTTTNTGSTKFCVEADTTTDNPMSVSNTRTTSVTDYAIIFYRAGSLVGSVQTSLSSTVYATSSDYRLKENVVDLDGAITRVKQLAPKRFNFIDDAGTTVDGFLAHEAQTVVPEAVTGTHDQVDGDGNPVMQGIDQSKLVPLLTAALQEAIAKIETLEAKVAVLEAAS